MALEGGGLLVWWEGFLRRRLLRRADDDGEGAASVAGDGDEVNMMHKPTCRSQKISPLCLRLLYAHAHTFTHPTLSFPQTTKKQTSGVALR
jgi:hypothetical protein